MPETATKEERHSLPIKSIRTCPANPRTNPEIGELVASVCAHGIIQPLVVRPRLHGFKVVAGERRLRAAKAAGLKEVPVVVREYSADEAREVRLVENLQREDLLPLEEAAAIQELLDAGKSVAEVADHLGKTVRYTARRASLSKIPQQAAAVAKAKKLPLTDWPPQALELLALFEPGIQAAVVEDALRWGVPDPAHLVGGLEHMVETTLRQLKRAPFDIQEETLVPEAGACTNCPHQSAQCPGLFEDAVPVDQPGEAICRNPSCWEGKMAANLELKAAAAAEKHGDALLCVRLEHGEAVAPKALGKVKPLSSHEFDRAKKSEKGARPAFAISGKQAGKVIWVKPKKGATTTKAKSAAARAKGKGKSTPPIAAEIKEREEKLQRRRTVWIFDAILDQLEGSSCPTLSRLVAMVQIYGASASLTWEHSLADRKNTLEEYSKLKVWHQVVGEIRKRLARHGSEIPESNWKETLWLAREFLGMKEKDLREQAAEANPEPKVLQRLKESQEPAA